MTAEAGGPLPRSLSAFLGFLLELLRSGFVCFGVLCRLVDQLLSHTSPLGFRGGSGYPGLTSGFCVSPPGPDAVTPPVPPGTDLKCPHLQTPATKMLLLALPHFICSIYNNAAAISSQVDDDVTVL